VSSSRAFWRGAYRLDDTPRKLGGRGDPVEEERLHFALADAAQLIFDRPPRSRVIVIHELVLPNGRPDVAFAAVDMQRLRRRTEAGISSITAPALAYVVAEARRRRGRMRVNDLVRRQSSAEAINRVTRAISRLSSLGVVSVSGDTLILHRTLQRPILHELHAVEAKLNGWSKAARQAHGWDRFVDSSWLAFPDSYLSHVPRRASALRSFGLLSVDHDDAVGVVRRARARAVTPLNRTLAEEAVLARWTTS
jgi:hypothetical protein